MFQWKLFVLVAKSLLTIADSQMNQLVIDIIYAPGKNSHSVCWHARHRAPGDCFQASVPCSVRQWGLNNLLVLTLFREGILCSFVRSAELITELAEHDNSLCCCLYGWRVKIASSIQSNKSVILITQCEVYCWYLDNRLLCACEQDPKQSQLTCFAFLPFFFLVFLSYRNFLIWKERMLVQQKNKRTRPFRN